MTLARRGATGLTLLLLAATVAGFLGDAWWAFDLAANLRPQYGLILILLTAGASLARWWDVAALAFVGFAVNAVLVVPLFVQVPPPPAQGAEDLRVMSLNVKISEARPDAVARHLRTDPPDLVFLFATTDRWTEAMRAADIPHEVLVAREPGRDLEIVVLSRQEDLPATVHRWGESNRSSAVQVTTTLDGEPVHVLGMHPVSPIGPERTARRNQSLARLARWARSQPDPVLVVGDLNATPWSHGLQRLLAEGGMINSQHGYGLSASWPTSIGPLGLPIDHALYSPELTVVSRRLGPSFGSPHRSLHITVARSSAEDGTLTGRRNGGTHPSPTSGRTPGGSPG